MGFSANVALNVRNQYEHKKLNNSPALCYFLVVLAFMQASDLFWDSTFGDLVEVQLKELVGKLVEYVECHCDKDGGVSDDDMCTCFCTFQVLMLQLTQKHGLVYLTRGLEVRMNMTENETDFSSGTSE